ncbi:purine-binding chemotaxis protein CheW [Hypnocyclicus thermotrophus]|uniref:Purine-binding chemotaxis protein CheW n=1 Tax=Hypnocyclicus thermotrophus TaxID=1627895 RepID=A0AA46I5H5_9FUSO|nr:chemotaxis protein CheW [Hypnocyclicus thermotrophus]TDT68099.1 purine-binding chemotaxis protein CheW [Hypnocyclicus thermotrophus]
MSNDINYEEMLKFSKSGEEFILFRLGEEKFLIHINHIQEIIINLKLKKIEELPEYILGIINLKGEIVPVFNIKKKLDVKNIEEKKKHKIYIIISNKKKNFALIVDEIYDTLIIEKEKIIKFCKINPYINAKVQIEETKEISIVNVDKIFETIK